MAQVPCVVYNCPTQSQNYKGKGGGEVYWKRISNPLSQEFESLRPVVFEVNRQSECEEVVL